MKIPQRLKPKGLYNGWQTEHCSENFKLFLKAVRKRIEEKDDDFLLMVVGPTGSGKSMLTLIAYEELEPEDCTIDNVSFCHEDHATSMEALMNKDGFKFIANDEANVQSRNATTKYNKDLIDLYFSIRGLNFFHWWNNPSLDVIDKVFIREKINGVICILNKDVKFPRLFAYYTKKAMLQIIEDKKTKGKITLDVLKKNVHKAAFIGWFRDYKGKLLVPYREKKQSRMKDKVTDFFEKYGSQDKLTKAQVSDKLGTANSTIYDRIKKLEGMSDWLEGEDYIKTNAKDFILPSGYDKIKSLGKN